MFENAGKWIQGFANKLLQPKTDAAREWGGVGRELAKAVGTNAPVEFGDLRQSAGLTVTEGSNLILDEPPIQSRLTESELDAKDYMRAMGMGYRE